MNRTKQLKGHCQSCGGHIEFAAEAAGMSVDCPHCGKVTELLLAAPPEEPMVPRRTIIWTALTVLILLAGLAAALVALNRAERRAVARRQAGEPVPAASVPNAQDTLAADQPDAVNQAGFSASNIILQKVPGSGLVYAVGTLTNTHARQRFGVKVTLELFDAEGQKVGEATDYQPLMESKGEWHFRALVVESKAASAKVASLSEER